ncbi:MAG: replication initiation protein [Spirochaetes bacterium]|nr:replication initiation protein [Spirochaetota bacterium]
MRKNLIVKHNDIIEGRYNLTLTEAKIIAKLTSMIKKDDEEFKEHIFKTKELLEELNLGNENYTALKDAIDKLITRKIEIKQEKKDLLVTSFLSSCLYRHSTGEIILRYDPNLKPYLLQLKANFTKYYIENVLNLRSFYAIRIYELCKQYETIKERNIEIEDLKAILDIKAESYNIYNRFKDKVLLIAQREINDKTDLKIGIEEKKTGRKVTSIKFIIEKKKTEENNTIIDDMPKIIKEKIKIQNMEEKRRKKEIEELIKIEENEIENILENLTEKDIEEFEKYYNKNQKYFEKIEKELIKKDYFMQKSRINKEK